MKRAFAVEKEQIAAVAGKLFAVAEEHIAAEEQLAAELAATKEAIPKRSYHERARDAHLLKRDVKALYAHFTRIEQTFSNLMSRIEAVEQHAQTVDNEIKKLRNHTGLIDWLAVIPPRVIRSK